MKYRKINELPRASRLPSNDEWILAVCKENTTNAVHSISVNALADSIRETVLTGSSMIHVEITDNGMQFKRVECDND